MIIIKIDDLARIKGYYCIAKDVKIICIKNTLSKNEQRERYKL